jgi:hypothetical protein
MPHEVNYSLPERHRIETEPGATPPCRPYYRMSAEERAELEKPLTDLLERGWIRPSKSPYGSPILFVRKPDGRLRAIIDYRLLNRQTTNVSAFPTPRIEDLLLVLHGTCVWSKLDLQQGFHQIPMDERDIPKTAFRTPFGSFEYLVMPMDCVLAPMTFQAMMLRILPPMECKHLLVLTIFCQYAGCWVGVCPFWPGPQAGDLHIYARGALPT